MCILLIVGKIFTGVLKLSQKDYRVRRYIEPFWTKQNVFDRENNCIFKPHWSGQTHERNLDGIHLVRMSVESIPPGYINEQPSAAISESYYKAFFACVFSNAALPPLQIATIRTPAEKATKVS